MPPSIHYIRALDCLVKRDFIVFAPFDSLFKGYYSSFVLN